MRKVCRVCEQNKKLIKFGVNRSQPNNVHYMCKKCNRKKRKEYFKTKNGVITDMYGNQNKSSLERGLNAPNYSKQQFKLFIMNPPYVF